MQFSFAQEKTITGNVTDPGGVPLPGVNIVIKGTTTGTQTDFDGNYSITASEGQVLVFTYVGMTTEERTVATASAIDVQMIEDAQALEEVVVTAMNIQRERSSVGSATTTVLSDDIVKGSQTNLSDALKGKVAGVVISNASTDPGSSSGVIIRGFSTLGGSNQPLYVVDGVPINNQSNFDNDLNGGYDFGRGSGDINPEDIESLTVLKGASGTSLYGSRAANGVILITTKKGSSEKLSIEYSSSVFFSDVLRVPKYQDKYGQGWDGQHYLIENGSWGPRFDNRVIPWGNVVDNAQKIKPYAFQKDQLRNFFDIGNSFINNIAVSGGKGSTSGRVSYSNTTTDGIFPTKADSYERNTLALSFQSELDFLTFGGTFNYVNTDGSAVATGQGLTVYNNLLQIPTDIDITEFKDYKNDPFNNVSNYYTPYGVTNPYFTLNEDGNSYKKERFYGSVSLTAKINDWSNVSYRLGLDQYSDYLKQWAAIVDAEPGSPNDGSSTEQPGSYGELMRFVKQVNHDIFYNLDLNLSEDVNIQSNFGLNYNERYTSAASASVSTQDIPGYYSFGNSASTPTVASSVNKRRLVGLLNSTTLSYKDMLYFTGNIRNDWYSTLPKANRSVLYGGINASWVFTRTFESLSGIISYGKLRAGYGETGVDTDPYQVQSTFVRGNVDNQGFRSLRFATGGLNAWEVGNRAQNPDLMPERRKEFEIGAELSFFKNRIGLDFTYYDAKVENQILALPLSPSSGYTTQTANIGTISNKGIEALLRLDIFKKRDGFNWTSTLNFGTNDAVLEELDDRIEQVDLGGLSTTTLVAREGEPLALIEGTVPLRDPDGRIVVDNNGVPIASPEKEVYGDTQYDYTLGISNDFSYKGISLGFTLDIRQGGLMYSRTASITRFTGNSITTMTNDRQPFVVPNSVRQLEDGTYVENTTAVDTEHMDDYHSASALDRETVIDKSFVKLREVTLSYRFAKSIIEQTPFDDLSISIVGRNLLLFTPESNQYIDPESSTFGTDLRSQFGEFSANPSTRSLGLTLKAKF
ncbi:SusC/RagA family TonB-linked outer membrane protein [Sinomicrobium sp. FJxs]|uniref:SusC/RagA family TonB-linked outer membrane protein n=2 Tax=Sinomicrobium weinanense TaxID=2842200 RepID=A0A926JT89_9FLAO|nr:SusC/RagA family TonB-linked outer membrane protein [Sinomicrobium weinanense]MBU3123669.1 SusC/RagA family TonB-linked outer membrane protein [Sinomicrobium weinanense]